jgi:hypothetical protein
MFIFCGAGVCDGTIRKTSPEGVGPKTNMLQFGIKNCIFFMAGLGQLVAFLEEKKPSAFLQHRVRLEAHNGEAIKWIFDS